MMTAITAQGDLHRATGPSHGPFAWAAGADSSSGNPASYFGYNRSQGGGRYVASEPISAYVIEADYDDGAKRTMEAYTEFGSADDSQYVRPLFFQVKRDAKYNERFLTRSSIMGDPLTVEGPDGANRALFEQKRLRLLAATGADAGLVIEAAPGRTTYLSLGADGTNDVLRIRTDAQQTSYAVVELGDSVPLRFYARPQGAPGAAISVGIQDNSAVGVFAVNKSLPSLKGIIVRGRDGQTGSLLDAQASDGTSLASIRRDGRLVWSAPNELAANAPGAPGPTATPRRFLRVVASDGTELLIPAY